MKKQKPTDSQKRIMDYIESKNAEGKRPSSTNIAMAMYSGFNVIKIRLIKMEKAGLIISKKDEYGFIHWEIAK